MKSVVRHVSRIFAVCLVAACLVAVSQAATDIHFDSDGRALNIPFELHNNQIYLRVLINGSTPLTVILDTGATTIISRKTAQKLGLKIQEQGEIQSIGESILFKVASAKRVLFKLPGVTLKRETVGVVTFEELERCLGHTADGILGLELFHGSVVEIDYKRRLINIYESKGYQRFRSSN